MADDPAIVPKPAFPYKTPPFAEYQREFLRRSAPMPAAMLSMAPGTGKTWMCINTAAYLYMKGKIDGMVVLAPNGVHTEWVVDQLPQHMPDAVPWKAHLWVSAKERHAFKKRQDKQELNWELAELAKDKSVFPVLAMNSEACTLPLAKKAILTFLKHRRCLFVVDESGDFTTPSAARTRALMNWRRLAPYRRCLDGTPVGTEPLELYAPFRFLNPNILGYPTYKVMKETHAEWETFVKGGDTPDLTPEERAKRSFTVIKRNPITGKKCWKDLDVLAQKIKPYTFRITKEEALPFLPPKLYHKRYFSMTQEQWRLTTELRENLTAELAGGAGTITATNVLTAYLRYQQIACGYVPPDIVYGEDTEPISIIPGPNPRLELCVEELLRYDGRPTIVWTRFMFDIDLLRTRLAQEGFSVVTYDGRTTPTEREDAKRRFQAGEVNVFLGNPAAGGRGLNLQRAEFEIFYANYFGLRRRLQAEDRGHRIGTVVPVNITDLLGYRSIDMTIVKALRENKEVADVITGDPLREWI